VVRLDPVSPGRRHAHHPAVLHLDLLDARVVLYLAPSARTLASRAWTISCDRCRGIQALILWNLAIIAANRVKLALFVGGPMYATGSAGFCAAARDLHRVGHLVHGIGRRPEQVGVLGRQHVLVRLASRLAR